MLRRLANMRCASCGKRIVGSVFRLQKRTLCEACVEQAIDVLRKSEL